MTCCPVPPTRWWTRRAPTATGAWSGSASPLAPTGDPDRPSIPPRALGWLRVLHEKLHLPGDDWSQAGRPHESWDHYSDSPLLSWHRFDLIDSSFALAVLADRTPAWRELYIEILDELLARYVQWWGAADWHTLIGEDPDRHRYPLSWKGRIVPEPLFGGYNAPGWMGNGLAPWGVQPDPIGADGNLFYKGFLSLMLALRRRIAGPHDPQRAFVVARELDGGFPYTPTAVHETIERQWAAHPEGCHCENTKIWPTCLTAAALGLHLHDATDGTGSHWVFDQWWELAQRRYLQRDHDGRPRSSILYFDPIFDIAMRGNPHNTFELALFLAPQRPDIARHLWHAACAELGVLDDSPTSGRSTHPRALAQARALAHEFGDEPRAARLAELVDAQYEPRWTAHGGFFFGLGLNERHPRGQLNATMMLAESLCGPGQWRAAFGPVSDQRFAEPTVHRVDFPTLGIHQADFDETSRTLVVSTYAATPTDGATSSFVVTGLPDANACTVQCDGNAHRRTRLVDQHTIALTCSVADHTFRITDAAADPQTQPTE